MSIDKTKCCDAHSKEKEDNGECCQQEEQERAEQRTYEHSIKTKEQRVSELLQEGMKLQRRLEDE